MMVNPYRR
jgi:hypothetical protein